MKTHLLLSNRLREASGFKLVAVTLLLTLCIITMVPSAWSQENAATPSSANPEGGTASSAGMQAAAGFSTLLYLPLKAAFALGGAIVGGLTYIFSGANEKAAMPVWVTSIYGTYIITPDHLQGNRPIRFLGVADSNDASEPASAPEPIRWPMKPIIGVTPDFNAGDRKEWGGREPTYFLRGRYIRAIEELGGVPLVLPLHADRTTRRRILHKLDGLLITGSGPDLPPALYGERQRFPFKIVSERRANFELDIVRLAKQADLPLLGICGGMQTMNVACGGSLIQDISSQISEPLQHRQQTPGTNLSHTVTVVPGSLLRRIVRSASMGVNSSHHQSVNAVAPSLIASAQASDGIVEAIESPTHRFFLGIQWHPEFLFDRYPLHRRLFEAFLRASRATNRGI